MVVVRTIVLVLSTYDAVGEGTRSNPRQKQLQTGVQSLEVMD